MFLKDTPDPGSDFGIAGAVAIDVANHDVETIVGDAARVTVPPGQSDRTHLATDAGIGISASIEEKGQTASTSAATKPEGDDAALAVAIALGIGIFQNTAKATVGRFADLDAAAATDVSATVTYPFLISDPASAINPAEFLSSPDAWTYVNDGTAGFSSNLFNTFILTSASQAKTSAGGSIGIILFENTADALVRSGAEINQSDDSRFRDGGQGVSVTATIEMHLIGVVGVGGLSLNLAGVLKNGETLWKNIQDSIKTNKSVKGALRGLVDPLGPRAARAASVHRSCSTSRPTSRPPSSRAVPMSTRGRTGCRSRLPRRSRTCPSCRRARRAARSPVAGAFPVFILDDTTTAQLGAGAIVHAGSLVIDALDHLDRLAIAGGVVAGESVGVGVAIAINIISRHTNAFIGAVDGTTATAGSRHRHRGRHRDRVDDRRRRVGVRDRRRVPERLT